MQKTKRNRRELDFFFCFQRDESSARFSAFLASFDFPRPRTALAGGRDGREKRRKKRNRNHFLSFFTHFFFIHFFIDNDLPPTCFFFVLYK